MKRLLTAIGIAMLLGLYGCTESQLIGDIVGSWRVARYTVHDKVDHYTYDTLHHALQWSINSNNSFTQSWQCIHQDTVTHSDTAVRYNDKGEKIQTVSYHHEITKGWKDNHVKGTWHLVNSNKFLQTEDSINGTTLYRIADQNGNSMVLEVGLGTLQLVH